MDVPFKKLILELDSFWMKLLTLRGIFTLPSMNQSQAQGTHSHGVTTTKDSILQSILDHRHANKLMMKMLCFTEDNMIEVRA